jgi:hypothetical protein
MNRSFVPTLLRASAILCLACFFAPFVHAQGCTNASYYGTSVFELQGTVPAILSNVPYVAIGREVADGNGNVTGTYVDSTNGTAGGGSYSGTYTIAADCSGAENISITPRVGTPFASSSTFQVSAGGRTGLSAKNPTGYVLAGQSFRAAAQGSAARCGNASLAGGYDFLSFGTIQGVSVTKVGQLTLDGKGNVEFKATVNLQSTGIQSSNGTGSYTVAADCTGNMTILRNDGFNDTFDFVVQEGGGLLLLEPDNTENTFGLAQPQVDSTVLGQFAFNGGWYSALYFNNESPGAVSFTVNFVGDNGNPLNVPALNGSSTTVQIPAGGSAKIEAPNSTTTLSEGYAAFTLPPGVTGYGVFRQSVPGRVDQEAVCPFAPSTATVSTLLFDDTNGLITAIAIVNPSAIAATVQATAYDSSGNQLGMATIPLAAYSKTEAALHLISGLSGVTGNAGKVVFTVSSGSVAVLGLRFDGFAFTSIPAQQ